MMRFQFAFIAVVVLAVSMVIADDAFDESKAIQKIELLGGKVMRDETLPGSPVIGVDLHRSKRFNDKYLHLLKSFPNLTTLNICETAITDIGLKEIGELKGLMEFWFNGDKITDEGLTELKNSLPNTKVHDFNPDELKAANEILGLGGDVVRVKLGNKQRMPFSSIHSVVFHANTTVNDTHLHLLQEFTSLRQLSLSQTKITDCGLKEIGGLTHMTQLSLYGTVITDAGLKEIGHLTNLTLLNLTHTKITDAGLTEIGELKRLTTLYLSNTKITDAGLKEIGGLSNLTHLYLNGTVIADAGLKELGNLTTLKQLDLRDTPNITDAGMKELKKSLPLLEIVR